jgi:3-oxoacyl-[acyl-carrier protein] reductase
MDFRDKKVVVTGASRGIGQAVASLFAQHGATVIGTATTIEGAAKISTALAPKGLGLCLDVTDTNSLDNFRDELAKQDLMPDILVNNAGITCDDLLLRMTEEQWSKVIDTNLSASFRLCKRFIKPMLKKRAGRIINISSVVGVRGNAGQCNYASAKAGLIGFTKSMALEVAGRNITVNAIAPGFISTDMTRDLAPTIQEALLQQIPLKRLGQVDDIAHAAIFLASAGASYITGETLHVNGGLYMA